MKNNVNTSHSSDESVRHAAVIRKIFTDDLVTRYKKIIDDDASQSQKRIKQYETNIDICGYPLIEQELFSRLLGEEGVTDRPILLHIIASCIKNRSFMKKMHIMGLVNRCFKLIQDEYNPNLVAPTVIIFSSISEYHSEIFLDIRMLAFLSHIFMHSQEQSVIRYALNTLHNIASSHSVRMGDCIDSRLFLSLFKLFQDRNPENINTVIKVILVLISASCRDVTNLERMVSGIGASGWVQAMVDLTSEPASVCLSHVIDLWATLGQEEFIRDFSHRLLGKHPDYLMTMVKQHYAIVPFDSFKFFIEVFKHDTATKPTISKILEECDAFIENTCRIMHKEMCIRAVGESLYIHTYSLTQEDLSNCLGKGAYGRVYPAVFAEKEVAVKRFVNGSTHYVLQSLSREIRVMKALRHPNIVEAKGFCMEEGNQYIVMEKMHMPLDHVLHSHEELPWERRYSIALDIARGIHHMHSLGYVHNDIKSSNILLTKHYTAKLADFNFSEHESDVKYPTPKGCVARGTKFWMAPELFLQGSWGKKTSDIYALGMVFWEILSRRIPYMHDLSTIHSSKALKEYVLAGGREIILLDADVAADFVRLITACWSHIVSQRPVISAVVERLESVLLMSSHFFVKEAQVVSDDDNNKENNYKVNEASCGDKRVRSL